MMPAIENVFLDRDGTLIEERHYLSDPDQVRLIAGTAKALRDLTSSGCRLYLVTNQSGIGRGYFSKTAYEKVQGRLRSLLRKNGVALSGEAYCPHAPDQGCSCRKPGAGLYSMLGGQEFLSPSRSAMIGDKTADIAFGKHCGFRTSILVLTGHGAETAQRLGLPLVEQGTRELDPSENPELPDVVAADLPAACRWIEKINHRLSR